MTAMHDPALFAADAAQSLVHEISDMIAVLNAAAAAVDAAAADAAQCKCMILLCLLLMQQNALLIAYET